MAQPNRVLGGINHVALVCRDMAETTDFYTNILGMPLVKTVELPNGAGLHYFFDCGGGSKVAFFWLPDAPPPAPGIAMPNGLPDREAIDSAVASMNHLAFQADPDTLETLRDQLTSQGIEVTEVWNHDESEWGLAPNKDSEGVFIRSIYFLDPNGILLEFAGWTRPLDESDIRPVTGAKRRTQFT